MTNEGESETVKWIESKGAKYAYAYDKGGKLQRFFGVTGIPAAVLVDASGTILWQGHPGNLDEGLVAKATAGALPKPMWEWSPATKGVKNALLKKQYKAAIEEAAKLTEADGAAAIQSAIQGIVKSKLELLKASYAKGDFLGAETQAAGLQKELAGLPEAEEATKVAADIKANDKAAAVIKAQKQIAKIRAGELRKKKEIEAAIEDLQKIQKANVGTFAAEEASELITRLRGGKG